MRIIVHAHNWWSSVLPRRIRVVLSMHTVSKGSTYQKQTYAAGGARERMLELFRLDLYVNAARCEVSSLLRRTSSRDVSCRPSSAPRCVKLRKT